MHRDGVPTRSRLPIVLVHYGKPHVLVHTFSWCVPVTTLHQAGTLKAKSSSSLDLPNGRAF